MSYSPVLPQRKPSRVCANTRAQSPSIQTVAAEKLSRDISDFSETQDGVYLVPAVLQRRLGAVMFGDHVWQRIGERLNLSPRERQILLQLFDDEKETVIATRLGISPPTVHMHIERLYRKLDVGGRMNMALRVVETFFRLCVDPQEQLPPICRNHANGSCPLRS